MCGKTLGEARKELVASGVTGETLERILPHKVYVHVIYLYDK